MLMADSLFAESYYAHVSEDGRVSWPCLVGANLVFARFVDRTAQFAAEFGCGEWGHIAGCDRERYK